MKTNKLGMVLFFCTSFGLADITFISPSLGQITQTDSSTTSPTAIATRVDSLLLYAEKYIGTPYRKGGKSEKGFDCSGFVYHVYKKFNITMPYSCPGISSVCSPKLKKTEIHKGDLLFFKGSNYKSNAIGHVAIVYEVNQNNSIQMIHACRRGIVLETLDSSKYYKARFLFARRAKGLY